MKRLATLFFTLLFSCQFIYAQSPTCDCKADLDHLMLKVKEMPSFKKQIKGDKLKAFNTNYSLLASKMTQPLTIENCYKMLQDQMMMINDLHAKIYFNHEYLRLEDYKNEDKRNTYISSEHFKAHPRYSKDIDSLENALKKSSFNSIEGVYNYGTQIVVGIYNTSDKHIEGVILSSEASIWQRGQIKFTGTINEFGKYDILSYDDRTRKLQMLKGLRYENGRLKSYKKVSDSNNYELSDKHESNWVFKQLRPDTQYVYFGDFSSFSSTNRKAFKSFYNKYKKAFNAENIIVDLRNNGGGNSKLSDPFIKLFRKSNANIYIITNTFTGSNSEQFTVKLKSLKTAQHLGQSTYGVIAYGVNYGTTYTLPSGYFDILPTDMNFHKYYEYEGKGIEPDIQLNFDRNWIDQTLDIIDASK